MIIALFMCAIFVLSDLPSVLSDNEGDSCITPNKERARCRKYSQCFVMVRAVNTGRLDAREFASKSQCGYSSEALVCCGSSGYPIPQPSSSASSTSSILQHRLLPGKDACGIQTIDDKIVNGEVTALREFPWMALLVYEEEGVSGELLGCGGSLINKRYVLTAGHCIVRRYGTTLKSVRLGEHNTRTERDCEGIPGFEVCNTAITFGIESAFTHNEYKKKNKENDIGLVRLDRNVQFSDYIQPICLPTASSTLPDGSKVWLSGWGETESDQMSAIKRKVELVVVSDASCGESLSRVIRKSQFCAGGKIKDTCNGDSGGPAIRTISSEKSRRQWIQEGLVSFGQLTCGNEGFPGVYTRVSTYANWILSNIFA